MESVNLERRRLGRERCTRVQVTLVCGLLTLLVPVGAVARQDGAVVNPFEGDPAARRAGGAIMAPAVPSVTAPTPKASAART